MIKAKTDKLLSKVDLEALPAGMHHDGRGLYLAVAANGAGRSWVYRYRFGAKIKHMGLGSLEKVTLPEARTEHRRWLPVLWAKMDPIAERDRAERERTVAGITFKTVAEEWLAFRKPDWRNKKHVQQAENTLANIAYPVIGGIAVAALTRADILSVLQPRWLEIPETMSRLKGRIIAILDFAIGRGYLETSPADDRLLKSALRGPARAKRINHHPSLPFADMPAFMADLRQQIGIAPRCLDLLILTAARTSEARLARWSEIDLDKALWTIPGERTKSGRDHRVPLVPRAVAILRSMVGLHREFVFAARKGKPLSDGALLMLLGRMGRDDVVTHGFRASFRMWAADTNSAPREVVEMALAHILKDATEAAYQRSDLYERRRVLMQDWAGFLAGETEAAKLRVIA
jgi:integrase